MQIKCGIVINFMVSWAGCSGVLGEVKDKSVFRDNRLRSFSSSIRGDRGRIVDVEAGTVDNQLRERADGGGQVRK